MADQLYLSLWYPNFRLTSLPAAIEKVMEQFGAVAGSSRVKSAAAYPLSWNEAPAYQRVYDKDHEPRRGGLRAAPGHSRRNGTAPRRLRLRIRARLGAMDTRRPAVASTPSGAVNRASSASSASGPSLTKPPGSRTAMSASTSDPTRRSCRRKSTSTKRPPTTSNRTWNFSSTSPTPCSSTEAFPAASSGPSPETASPKS